MNREKKGISTMIATIIVGIMVAISVAGTYYGLSSRAPSAALTLTEVSTAMSTLTTTAAQSGDTVTQSNALTQTVTQFATSTTTQTVTSTSSSSSWTGSGRPPLYPFTITVTDFCSGASAGCTYTGQIEQTSGVPTNVNNNYNTSYTFQPFYEGGCAPSGPCRVEFDWSLGIPSQNQGGGDYLSLSAYYNGQVVADQAGAQVTGSVCLEYCS